MKSKRYTPKRYQLTKHARNILETGHPWIFRRQLSSAAEAFGDGQWLALYDGSNRIVGYGIYEAEGLIGIRILKRGAEPPDTEWLGRVRQEALARRANLRKYTDSFRVLHGENDGIPGVVLDLYGGETLVLQTYSAAVDALGRYLGEAFLGELGARNLVWKIPTRRRSPSAGKLRRLRGTIPESVPVREGKRLTYRVPVAQGQKSGSFLDLRGLRKWLSQQKFAGKRVLNLFSYTGTLGLAAELGGAKEVWNVDVSEGALAFGKQYHFEKPGVQKWIAEDVFEWIGELSRSQQFDCIIVDPPSMVSSAKQVAGALKTYGRIYRAVMPHLKPGGTLIGACCTSRIERSVFQREMDRAVGGRLRLFQSLSPEDDHPVGFPEGDYLKILIYQ